MSIETWKKEFYPRSAASRMSKKSAIEHSIKKWEGLLSENLKKHEVVIDVCGDVHDDEISFEISDQSCALCQKYMHKCCVKCPLYEKLGFECGKGKIEAGDGWVSYMEEGSPELMLKNLRSLLDEDKK